jgi:hypothetical protein
MKRAEKIIRQQIDDLSMYRIGPRKQELQQAIKFMFWQGSFKKKTYELLNNLLEDKYTEIMNNYETHLVKQSDEDYERLLKHYNMTE